MLLNQGQEHEAEGPEGMTVRQTIPFSCSLLSVALEPVIVLTVGNVSAEGNPAGAICSSTCEGSALHSTKAALLDPSKGRLLTEKLSPGYSLGETLPADPSSEVSQRS